MESENCKHRLIITHLRKVMYDTGFTLVTFHECAMCSSWFVQIIDKKYG